MKNDALIDGMKISVPPTLLVSAIGTIQDIRTAVTSDAKRPGDLVYVLGETREELRGSEYACAYRSPDTGELPQLNIAEAWTRYLRLYEAIRIGLVTSCHDCSDGGLAVALAETAMGGHLGIRATLNSVPCDQDLDSAVILFSETPSRFVLTVRAADQQAFETMMMGDTFACIGEVIQEPLLDLGNVMSCPLERLLEAHTADPFT